MQPRFEMPAQYESERQATPPVTPSAPSAPREEIPDDPAAPEWRMAPLPPEEPPKRRRWVWVLVGIVVLFVLLCCGLGVFLSTGPGEEFLNDLATRAAEMEAQGN